MGRMGRMGRMGQVMLRQAPMGVCEMHHASFAARRRTFVTAVDAPVQGHIQTINVLAASPSLATGWAYDRDMSCLL